MLFEEIRHSMKSQLSKEKNSSSFECKTPSKNLNQEIHKDIWSCFDEIVDKTKPVPAEMDGSTSESDGNLTQEDEPEGSQANSNFDRSDSIRSKTVLNRELDKYLVEPMCPRGSDPMV